jgi:hypothetical protein
MRPKSLLILILFVSWVLRILLVAAGGQFYWPDEYRYQRSRDAVEHTFCGDVRHALGDLDKADHFLFRVVGVIPATVEYVVEHTFRGDARHALGDSDEADHLLSRVVGVTSAADEHVVEQHAKIPALFFSFFSVLCLWLIWRIALKTGAEEPEALLATFLLALASSFLYYSRHLLPYDLSMAFGLSALLVALRNPPKYRDSCLCGLLCSACFLSYNGYWTLAFFAILVHGVYSRDCSWQFISRVAASVLSFAAPLVILVGLNAARGVNFLQEYVSFAAGIRQGTFSEGWSLPFEYLWHAEHFLLPVWILAFACCLYEARSRSSSRRPGMAMAGVLFICGTLVLFSVGLHKFVVYGRLARQLVPFFCLITAYCLSRLRSTNAVSRWLLAVVCFVLALQAGLNFCRPLVQAFPREFKQRAGRMMASSGEQYTLLYVHHIWPVHADTVSSPFTVICRQRHPLEFLPYQYEGYDPNQRRFLRSNDISMCLVVSREE